MTRKIGNYKLETSPMTNEQLFALVEETAVARGKAEMYTIAEVLPEDETFTEAEAYEWCGIDDWIFDDLFNAGLIVFDLPTGKYKKNVNKLNTNNYNNF